MIYTNGRNKSFKFYFLIVCLLRCLLLQVQCNVGRDGIFIYLQEHCSGNNYLKAVSILPLKCRRQRLRWSYCAASPKLGRNKVKTKDKP